MRKRISFIMLVLFICIIFYACSNQRDLSSNDTNNSIVATANKEREITISNERHDIREIAYNQLTPNDKQRISGTWDHSKLSTIMLKQGMGTNLTSSFIGKEVYMIDFQTKDISIPNNMIVYVKIDTYKLIGYGIVD